ncbi:hypothetical protein L226DRAFT_32208 [Lentinus tigrinus ALCF2SS1-7]|uniref:uncharacterized protein n=1 Tax=Lentinus tigrinus ALCF2SS1-7 TaxID=1328758 RepID=UPI001165F30D|nr:hypothetical protein L226DRAFT_32208 [Lentinus tigrinus ALCF2SS1-7]
MPHTMSMPILSCSSLLCDTSAHPQFCPCQIPDLSQFSLLFSSTAHRTVSSSFHACWSAVYYFLYARSPAHLAYIIISRLLSRLSPASSAVFPCPSVRSFRGSLSLSAGAPLIPSHSFFMSIDWTLHPHPSQLFWLYIITFTFPIFFV